MASVLTGATFNGKTVEMKLVAGAESPGHKDGDALGSLFNDPKGRNVFYCFLLLSLLWNTPCG
jgi:hypothetical protein